VNKRLHSSASWASRAAAGREISAKRQHLSASPVTGARHPPVREQIENLATPLPRFKRAARSCFRQSLAQAHARCGKSLVLRREDVALEEIAGERQSQPHFARPRLRRGEEKWRQREQLVAPGLAGGERNRPPGLGRNESEIVVRAGGGAALEIEAEAKRCEQPHLEAHIGRRPIRRR